MPYSDSSSIVKGFCFDFGVQSFLVKSAKSSKNAFKSSLDPLAESEIVFNDSGKSDLHFIREATLIDWFPNLRKDLEKTAMAEVMAEILLRYLPTGLSQELEFRYTEKALQVLDRGTCPQDALARWMWHIADCAGYALSVDACIRCGNSISGDPADFLFESGGALCKDCLGVFLPHYPPEFLKDIACLTARMPLRDPRALEGEFFKYLKTHLGENREIKSYRWLQEVRGYAFSTTDQRT
jgi:DNA repair protein RecO (recombination protein O)